MTRIVTHASISLIAVVLLLTALSTSALAETIELVSVRDNMLAEDATGSLSNGAGQRTFTGQTLQTAGSAIRRALVKFDIASSIPAGSTIDAVTLQLTVVRHRGTSHNVDVHRALTDWGEGTSIGFRGEAIGASATPTDATWLNNSFPDQLWTTPGGDFAPTASATQFVGTSGTTVSWSSEGLRSDVQAMLDNPAADFGWILIGDETGTAPTARGFGTRENSSAPDRPKLVIEYSEAAPVPASSPLAAIALVLGLACVGAFALRRASMR